MDIQAKKIELIQAFLNLKSEAAIKRLELFFKQEKEFTAMSVEELNTRISESEKDFEEGNTISNSDLLKKYA